VLGAGLTVGAAVVTTSCASVSRSCAGGIFVDTPRQGSVPAAPARTVRRLRRVEVDFPRLFPAGSRAAAGAAERLTLNLFPDACLVAVRARVTDLGPGRVQWEGRVPAASHGTVTLVIDGEVMVGTVRIDREVFEIRYLGDGVHAVAHIDPSGFPPD
jgi:hypothetical protein